MLSRPMNTRATPARPAFSMKCGRRWHMVSTWITNLMFSFSCSRMAIRRSKTFSQSVLRAKLSSVMKKRLMPCARLLRMICSMSSAERRRDLRPCTLMMVQKEHRNGQPRPASKLVILPPVRLMRWRENRHGRAVERRQIVHVVVERLQRAVPGVAQNVVEAAFGLAGEERDAEIHGFFEFGRQLGQHGQATGDVKTADADRHAGGAKGRAISMARGN